MIENVQNVCNILLQIKQGKVKIDSSDEEILINFIQQLGVFKESLNHLHNLQVKQYILKVVDLMELQKFPKGSTICLYGDEGNSFSLLLRGSCQVFVSSKLIEKEEQENQVNLSQRFSNIKSMTIYEEILHNQKQMLDATQFQETIMHEKLQMQKLCEFNQGSFFGQYNLKEHLPRAATIKATKDCSFLSLQFHKFNQFDSHYLLENKNKIELFLKFFPYLPNYVVSILISQIVEINMSLNNWVFHIGDRANKLYFIVQGQIEILVSGEIQQSHNLQKYNRIDINNPGAEQRSNFIQLMSSPGVSPRLIKKLNHVASENKFLSLSRLIAGEMIGEDDLFEGKAIRNQGAIVRTLQARLYSIDYVFLGFLKEPQPALVIQNDLVDLDLDHANKIKKSLPSTPRNPIMKTPRSQNHLESNKKHFQIPSIQVPIQPQTVLEELQEENNPLFVTEFQNSIKNKKDFFDKQEHHIRTIFSQIKEQEIETEDLNKMYSVQGSQTNFLNARELLTQENYFSQLDLVKSKLDMIMKKKAQNSQTEISSDTNVDQDKSTSVQNKTKFDKSFKQGNYIKKGYLRPQTSFKNTEQSSINSLSPRNSRDLIYLRTELSEKLDELDLQKEQKNDFLNDIFKLGVDHVSSTSEMKSIKVNQNIITDRQIEKILSIKHDFVVDHEYGKQLIQFSNPLYFQISSLGRAQIKQLKIDLEKQENPIQYSQISRDHVDDVSKDRESKLGYVFQNMEQKNNVTQKQNNYVTPEKANTFNYLENEQKVQQGMSIRVSFEDGKKQRDLSQESQFSLQVSPQGSSMTSPFKSESQSYSNLRFNSSQMGQLCIQGLIQRPEYRKDQQKQTSVDFKEKPVGFNFIQKGLAIDNKNLQSISVFDQKYHPHQTKLDNYEKNSKTNVQQQQSKKIPIFEKASNIPKLKFVEQEPISERLQDKVDRCHSPFQTDENQIIENLQQTHSPRMLGTVASKSNKNLNDSTNFFSPRSIQGGLNSKSTINLHIEQHYKFDSVKKLKSSKHNQFRHTFLTNLPTSLQAATSPDKTSPRPVQNEAKFDLISEPYLNSQIYK